MPVARRRDSSMYPPDRKPGHAGPKEQLMGQMSCAPKRTLSHAVGGEPMFRRLRYAGSRRVSSAKLHYLQLRNCPISDHFVRSNGSCNPIRAGQRYPAFRNAQKHSTNDSRVDSTGTDDAPNRDHALPRASSRPCVEIGAPVGANRRPPPPRRRQPTPISCRR